MLSLRKDERDEIEGYTFESLMMFTVYSNPGKLFVLSFMPMEISC